uniref:ATP synthase F0 subunit 8 n=1 Tax=Panagrolaimus superbus TaxID=310955 RepID=A0A914Y8Y9_9BILA
MGLQSFQFIDYMGAPLCFIIFFLILFLLSTIINFTLITKSDDITKFEYVGAKHNHKWGPHSISYIQDTKEKEDAIRSERN